MSDPEQVANTVDAPVGRGIGRRWFLAMICGLPFLSLIGLKTKAPMGKRDTEYAIICDFLRRGFSVNLVGSLMRVSPWTVLAIKNAEGIEAANKWSSGGEAVR